jgi:hypothetical protein
MPVVKPVTVVVLHVAEVNVAETPPGLDVNV